MSEFDKERFFELVKILHRIVDLLGWNLEQTNGLARCFEAKGLMRSYPTLDSRKSTRKDKVFPWPLRTCVALTWEQRQA